MVLSLSFIPRSIHFQYFILDPRTCLPWIYIEYVLNGPLVLLVLSRYISINPRRCPSLHFVQIWFIIILDDVLPLISSHFVVHILDSTRVVYFLRILGIYPGHRPFPFSSLNSCSKSWTIHNLILPLSVFSFRLLVEWEILDTRRFYGLRWIWFL